MTQNLQQEKGLKVLETWKRVCPADIMWARNRSALENDLTNGMLHVSSLEDDVWSLGSLARGVRGFIHVCMFVHAAGFLGLELPGDG